MPTSERQPQASSGGGRARRARPAGFTKSFSLYNPPPYPLFRPVGDGANCSNERKRAARCHAFRAGGSPPSARRAPRSASPSPPRHRQVRVHERRARGRWRGGGLRRRRGVRGASTGALCAARWPSSHQRRVAGGAAAADRLRERGARARRCSAPRPPAPVARARPTPGPTPGPTPVARCGPRMHGHLCRR